MNSISTHEHPCFMLPGKSIIGVVLMCSELMPNHYVEGEEGVLELHLSLFFGGFEFVGFSLKFYGNIVLISKDMLLVCLDVVFESGLIVL